METTTETARDVRALENYVRGTLPAIDDGHAEALYAAGHAFYENDDYVRAADVFRLLAFARPHSGRSWLALAATHDAAGEEDRALALYGIATEALEATIEERALAFLHLARLEHLTGESERASEDLARFDELAQELELAQDVVDTARWLTDELADGGGR